MRILSAITDPGVASRILKCLALPARAPPIAVAAHTPELALGTSWPQAEGGGAVVDFDQSLPEVWDAGA